MGRWGLEYVVHKTTESRLQCGEVPSLVWLLSFKEGLTWGRHNNIWSRRFVLLSLRVVRGTVARQECSVIAGISTSLSRAPRLDNATRRASWTGRKVYANKLGTQHEMEGCVDGCDGLAY